MRPKSNGGSVSAIQSPTCAAGFFLRASGGQDLRRVVLDLVDDEQKSRKAHLAGLRVDLGAHLGLLAVARAGRLLHSVLHRFQHDLAIDVLFAGNGVGDLQKLELVGGNRHGGLLVSVRAA